VRGNGSYPGCRALITMVAHLAPTDSARFGPYHLLYPLGAGGMGQVFLARHQGEHGIQRLVAIKRMLAHLMRRADLVNLFLDEVRIAAQLNHGNIVQVIDHGQIEGQYFMAMEYVHGENLLEVIHRLRERDESMPLDLALHVGSGICQGLSYAHAKQSIDGRPLGIVHRDISPQNVMIAFGGEVKIADFGVARAAEQTHQTVGGELKGKLAYMSPEQAWGRPLDQRSDLFSLGVVLYELLGGRSPFLRENPMATLEAVRAAQAVSLTALRADLPQEVVDLVHQALAPAAEDRPDSARTMYDGLQRAMRLHNMVVSAFDLADFMADLFPESRARDGLSSGAGTAVGRRADEQEQNLERRTLLYLKQRHPEVNPLAETAAEPDTRAVVRKVRGTRWRWTAFPLLAAVVTAGAFALLRGPPPSTSPVAAPRSGPDAASPTVARVDAAVRVDVSEPRPAASAWLEVRSRPAGAWVALEGKRLPGVTPLGARLSPGRHRCSVGAAGHRVLHRTVTLQPGQRLRLEPVLEPLAGRLTVTSTHACRVRVNDTVTGEAPLREHRVAPGQVAVSCVAPSGERLETRRVRIAPGATVTVSFRFGALSINLQPWASVTVDGRARGTTPLRLILPVGEHRVVLSNRERELESRRAVEVQTSRTARISSW